MTILRIGSERAFTLIEVLLTITILAVGMIGVLCAYSTMINAMEVAQYNIDAACLLKARMGKIEEGAITARGISPGENTGNLTKDCDIKVDNDYPNNWEWTEKAEKAEIAAAKKEEPEYYLNKVTLTVANAFRNPGRNVGIVTYMKSVAIDGR